jgi:two-component system LytT family sensor kinase
MIVLVSGLWTALRIWTFTLMTSEQDVWSDFGGWYFASFMVFLCWSALYYGSKYYFKAQEEHRKRMASVKQVESEQIKRLSAEADAREAQLKMLRYQLNPHFLFNTLNAIGALVKFQETDKAHRMIIQLGDFLRFSLENNPTLMITLEQEVDALMLYLNIEQTRFGDRLVLDFDICEQAKKARVPALLLQPMIENSVKYAISKNEDGGTIKLKANVEQGELKIELSDSGAGNNGHVAETKKRGRRVGLHNTLERLKTLYEDAYLFDISLRKSGGLRIRINIPFDTGTLTAQSDATDQLKSSTA